MATSTAVKPTLKFARLRSSDTFANAATVLLSTCKSPEANNLDSSFFFNTNTSNTSVARTVAIRNRDES